MARAHGGHRLSLGLPVGIGEIAALVTAAAWGGCAQFFGAAGLRIGSVAVNHLRLVAGLVILLGLHLVLVGTLLPHGMGRTDLLLLGLSGITGLIIGDAAYFRALVLIGPATATLMVTTAPAFATLEAWLFLDEKLSARALAGIAITVAGLFVAVRARMASDPLRREREGAPPVAGRTLLIGLALALGGTICQATGQVLARPVLLHADALSATLVRIITATSLLWLVLGARCAITRSRPAWWDAALADRRALLLTMGGVLTGPSFGVWLSQVAIKHAEVGVSATLMSLVPLFVMLSDWALGRARPSGAQVLGSLIAVAGVAVLVSAPRP